MSKLTDIQVELKAPKNQYNKFGKYSYRSCEDILEAVKPLLNKHDCSLKISDEVRDCALGSYVEATATFDDGGEHFFCVSAQAGIEKAGGMALPQAFGSASSYARKYALNGLFLIDDTKDADATNTDDKQPSKPTQAQVDAAVAKIKAAKSLDELKEVFLGLPSNIKSVSSVEAAKNKAKNNL